MNKTVTSITRQLFPPFFSIPSPKSRWEEDPRFSHIGEISVLDEPLLNAVTLNLEKVDLVGIVTVDAIAITCRTLGLATSMLQSYILYMKSWTEALASGNCT